MKCIIPGRGIRGEYAIELLFMQSALCKYNDPFCTYFLLQLLEKLSYAWQRLEMSCTLKLNLME